jgi:hypothetical protein
MVASNATESEDTSLRNCKQISGRDMYPSGGSREFIQQDRSDSCQCFVIPLFKQGFCSLHGVICKHLPTEDVRRGAALPVPETNVRPPQGGRAKSGRYQAAQGRGASAQGEVGHGRKRMRVTGEPGFKASLLSFIGDKNTTAARSSPKNQRVYELIIKHV